MVLAHKPVKHQHSQELKNSKARAVPRNPADVIKQMLSLETAQFAHSLIAGAESFKVVFPFHPGRERLLRALKSDWKSFRANDSQTWSELWMGNENWSCWPKWTFANLGPFFCPVNNFFEVRYTIRYTQFFFSAIAWIATLYSIITWSFPFFWPSKNV